MPPKLCFAFVAIFSPFQIFTDFRIFQFHPFPDFWTFRIFESMDFHILRSKANNNASKTLLCLCRYLLSFLDFLQISALFDFTFYGFPDFRTSRFSNLWIFRFFRARLIITFKTLLCFRRYFLSFLDFFSDFCTILFHLFPDIKIFDFRILKLLIFRFSGFSA